MCVEGGDVISTIGNGKKKQVKGDLEWPTIGTGIASLLNFNYSSECLFSDCVIFIFILLITNVVQHLFVCLLAICQRRKGLPTFSYRPAGVLKVFCV